VREGGRGLLAEILKEGERKCKVVVNGEVVVEWSV
jgi:hypothetical protein